MSATQSQLRMLASAVARVFAMAELTPEQRYPERIEHTRLAWMAPALMPTATLGGEDVAMFLDYPVAVDGPALHAWWGKTLHDLWHKPELTMRGGAYAGLGRLLRTSKVGVRALRFAQPPGYPHQLELQTGVQLSLEVAHTAFLSLPCKRVLTLDDYIVTTPDGLEFGVRAGRPIVSSPWDTYDASGDVLELLEQPRGPASHDCQYDQVAQLRSVIHEHSERFRGDFYGIDIALQALRCLSQGAFCPDLSVALRTEPANLPALRIKERLVRDAIDAMESDQLNDRQKLETLRANLVPDVLTPTAFKQAIFSSPSFPYTMLPGRANKIIEWLRNYYETEIPCSLKRSL